MNVIRVRALRGPNLWSRHTAIEAIVQAEADDAAPAGMTALEADVRRLFPALGPLRSGVRAPRYGRPHLLEAVALALQAQAGCPVSFSRTAATGDAGTYQVVVQYSEEAVGRLALELAQQLIGAAARGEGFDVAAAIAQLSELDEDERLGPSTGCIVEAAAARGIPAHRLTRGSLVRLGWGKRQRRIWAAELDSTSAVAESIAQDKELSKRLLEAAGVPVPIGRPVADAEQGWAAALEIGLPVVVKPRDGNQGKGVTVNISGREHFDCAFRAAAEHGAVMVEKYLPGDDFRLLVVGDRLVAAARRDPPQVIGDGVHTVRQLVERVNADPRRGDGHATSLTKIRFDDIAVARLAAQDLTPESVPVKGRRVVLRNNANLSTGGTATDVTDDVHPDVAARARAPGRLVGRGNCGGGRGWPWVPSPPSQAPLWRMRWPSSHGRSFGMRSAGSARDGGRQAAVRPWTLSGRAASDHTFHEADHLIERSATDSEHLVPAHRAALHTDRAPGHTDSIGDDPDGLRRRPASFPWGGDADAKRAVVRPDDRGSRRTPLH